MIKLIIKEIIIRPAPIDSPLINKTDPKSAIRMQRMRS